MNGHVSHGPKNPALLSMKYWMVNRDPYNGLLQSLYNWVVCYPLYQTTNQGIFHCSCCKFIQMRDFNITCALPHWKTSGFSWRFFSRATATKIVMMIFPLLPGLGMPQTETYNILPPKTKNLENTLFRQIQKSSQHLHPSISPHPLVPKKNHPNKKNTQPNFHRHFPRHQPSYS